MTIEDKVTRVKTLLSNAEEATDDVVEQYLDIAYDVVLSTQYPFGIPETVEDIDARYQNIQCELAARYFVRAGGLGEIEHNENGINRVYASVDDADLLRKITPKAKVLS